MKTVAVCEWVTLLLVMAGGLAAGPVEAAEIRVTPAAVELRGPESQQQLLVSQTIDGYEVDQTRTVKFTASDSRVIAVDERGVVRPLMDGSAQIEVTHGTERVSLPVRVSGLATVSVIDFDNDIQPILTAGGCNSGPCHGKSRGQNGFQLSLLAFDSDFDHAALTREARGRRVFLPSPEQSLLLLKPIGRMPHGGGLRLKPDSPEYRLIERWVRTGMPRRAETAPKLVRVSVLPKDRILKTNAQQQLALTAHYSDGSTRDVTGLAAYQSNEAAVAGVDSTGLVSTNTVTGEAAVMARYMGYIDVATISVPLSEPVAPDVYAKLPRNNFIDDLVWKKLERLRLTPSEPAPDHTWLRRVYVDVIGRVPSVTETRSFLADTSSDKRAKLVDRLLESSEYADHWANKWADLLRPNPYRVGIKTVLNYDNWIRSSFRKNKPYDEFVRELVTATGSTWRDGHVTLFRDRREPDELTTIVAQLFLGIRLECAKCHHHPNEVWGQEHFYGFAAFFEKLSRKGTGLSPPISGSEEFVLPGKRRPVLHPLTGAEMKPSPLFGDATVPDDADDPRVQLAEWMTSKDNPYFRQVIANRVWMDMMGRGLVEPVDDLRASNPPSNPELLEALAVDFRDHGYNFKHLIRAIASSYVYGLSSVPSDRNAVDTRNYSRFYRERLRAEVLLDSVSQITGVPEKFSAMPEGSQSRQLWSHRIENQFLDAFGRPDPNQDPPCERTPDTTIVQALHLMNSQRLYDKVTSDSGLPATLASSERTPDQIIEELFLSAWSRFPTEAEKKTALDYLTAAGDRKRKALEDLLWAMLNSPEFIFKH